MQNSSSKVSIEFTRITYTSKYGTKSKEPKFTPQKTYNSAIKLDLVEPDECKYTFLIAIIALAEKLVENNNKNELVSSQKKVQSAYYGSRLRDWSAKSAASLIAPSNQMTMSRTKNSETAEIYFKNESNAKVCKILRSK